MFSLRSIRVHLIVNKKFVKLALVTLLEVPCSPFSPCKLQVHHIYGNHTNSGVQKKRTFRLQNKTVQSSEHEEVRVQNKRTRNKNAPVPEHYESLYPITRIN